MFISSVTTRAPQFTGAYLDKKDAQKHPKQEVVEFTCGKDTVYLNDDESGQDLSNLREEAKYMFKSDLTVPLHKQDRGMDVLDMRLLYLRFKQLLKIAELNDLAKNAPDVD